jgi:hypothetical protein
LLLLVPVVALLFVLYVQARRLALPIDGEEDPYPEYRDVLR